MMEKAVNLYIYRYNLEHLVRNLLHKQHKV